MRFFHGTLILLAAACGGSGSTTDPDDDDAPFELVEITFTASPLRLHDVVSVTPLGSLNPPAHTIPNDHIGLNVQDVCPCDLSPRPVYAPADGTVRLVLRGQDDGLEVGQPPSEPGSERHPWYYMGHVLLAPDIVVGRRITAGEQIGTTGPYALGIDLGLVHPETRNTFIVRERYHAKALFGTPPLRHFTEPLRSVLYARVRRQGADLDGRFDYDVAGRLSGGWFHESLPSDLRSTGPDGWTRNLAFVAWHEEPDVPVVASGGTVLPALVYWVDPAAPRFQDIGTASGPVALRLYSARPRAGQLSPPGFVLLVQLVSETRLRVEAFPADARPTAFTASAYDYLR